MPLSIGELIAQLKAQGMAPAGSGTQPYGGTNPGTVDPAVILPQPGLDDLRGAEKETISQYLEKLTTGDSDLSRKNKFGMNRSATPGELGEPIVLVDPEGNPHPLSNLSGTEQSAFIYPGQGNSSGGGYNPSPGNSSPSGGATPDLGQPEIEAAWNTLSEFGFFLDTDGTDGPYLDKNAQTEGHYILNSPDTRDKVSAILQTTRFGLIATPDEPHSQAADNHQGFINPSTGGDYDLPNITQLSRIAHHYQAKGIRPKEAYPTARFIDANSNTVFEKGFAAKLDYGPSAIPPYLPNGQPITVLGNPFPADGSPATYGVPHTPEYSFRRGLSPGIATAELELATDSMMAILEPAMEQLDEMLGSFGPITITNNDPHKPWQLSFGDRFGTKLLGQPVEVDSYTGRVTSSPSASGMSTLKMLKTLHIPVPRFMMASSAAFGTIITTAVKWGVSRILHSTEVDGTNLAHWRILKRRLAQAIGPANNFGLPIPPPIPPGLDAQVFLGNDAYMQELANCAAVRFIRMFCIMSEPQAAGSVVAPGQPFRFSGRKDLNERTNAGPQRLSLSRVSGIYAQPIGGLSVKNVPSMMLLPRAFTRGRLNVDRGGGGSTPSRASQSSPGFGNPTSGIVPSLSPNHRTAGDAGGAATKWKKLLQDGGIADVIRNPSNIALRKKLGKPKDSNANRFSVEEVNAIENALEAEHMPFYFHDLRTNEVIAFHAFLQSLSDSYSPSFKASSGFGRIEDVQVYEKTTRSVSVSFIIAAMNPSDMNEMYFKINKLVSMIYPQFSRGTMLEHVGQDSITRFVQPFSQIPTASPVIRLRVGDLIKGNYNRDGVRRLMGVQDPDFVVAEPLPAEAGGTDCDEVVAAIKDIVNQVPIDEGGQYNTDGGNRGWPVGSKVLINPPYSPVVKLTDGVASSDWDTLITTDNTIFPVEILEYYSYENPLGGVPPYDIVIRVKMTNILNMSSVCSQNFTGDRIATDINGFGVVEVLLSYTDILHDATADLYCVDGTNGPLFPGAVADATTAGTTPAEAAAAAAGSEGAIRDVLFGDKNPIFQSFETTSGRGLAGVISSFDIDWMLNTAVWDTTPGQRAPTMCTINIGFTPIHDIVPGLDSDGMMRSVNYNVGGPSNKIGQDPHGNDTQAYASAATNAQDPY